MRINWTPQRGSYRNFAVSKSGDTLTVNGVSHDFSGVAEGGEVAAPSSYFSGPIKRANGELHVPLILPVSRSPEQIEAFPTPTFDAMDGQIEPPPQGSQPDLLAWLMGGATPTGMYARRPSGNDLYIGIGFPGGEKGVVVEYHFYTNTDNWIGLRGVAVGPGDDAQPWVGGMKPLDTSAAVDAITAGSIPDFAIRARPAGAAYSNEWVPQHASVTGVTSLTGRSILIDGSAAGASFGVTQITDFSMSQVFNALNPNGSDGVMWTQSGLHSMSFAKPWMVIENSLEFAQDTDVSVGYLGMLPADSDHANKLLLADGTTYTSIPQDDSETTFDETASSAVYLGDNGGGIAFGAAVRATGPVMQAAPGRLTFRSDGVSKVYYTALDAGTYGTGVQVSATQELGVCCGPAAKFSLDWAKRFNGL